MKTIKYLVAFLSAALMFAACEQDPGLSQQNKGKEKPTVTLTTKVAEDVTLSFGLTASENAAQYAYAVFPGTDNEVPSAYDILVEETFAAASGSFNTSLTEEDDFTATVTVDCSDFVAEKYQVFAAAITETGLVGDVAVLDVTMNDTWIPQPAGASVDKNVLTLAFDEEVVRGKGKAYVSIIAWGVGKFYMVDEPIADENITVEANTVTIVCPEAGNGAGYYVSFEEGLVTDLSGNKCEECVSGLDNDYQYVGLGWDTDWVNLPILDSYFETPAEGTDWGAEGASITFKLPVQMMDSGLTNPIQVLYDEDEGQSQLNAEYVLGEDGQTVTVYLPKMPTGAFDVSVAEGAFYDVWGNINNAYTPATYRYSNYLTALVEGLYLVDYLYPDAEGNPVVGQFPAEIELVDRSTAVIYADWFNYAYSLTGESGYVSMPYLVGTVNYADGTIVFDGRHIVNNSLTTGAFASPYYYHDSAKTQMVVFWGGGETGQEPVVITFNNDGYLDSMSYCDYTIHDAATGKGLTLFGCTAVTETANAAMTYVPSTEASSVVANAPARKTLEPVNVKGTFTK